MKMIDVAVPKFGDDAEDGANAGRPDINPVVRHTSFARSRSRTIDDDDEEYNVDHDSSSEEDDEDDEDGNETEQDKAGDGEKEEFFDTQDISTDVSTTESVRTSQT